jgi:acid phosphatase (class A)
MHRRHHPVAFLAALSLLALANVSAVGEEASCPEVDAVPLTTLLMPPSPDDSEVSRAELRELQDIQRLRTQEQEDHAGADHERSIDRFLGAIGVKVDARATIARRFFECVAKSAEKDVEAAKLKFSRLRPYKYPESNLRILKEAKNDDSPSYPSGHATYGMMVGLLLADMLPERRQDIMKRIEDYGYSRLISSVHFRSDVYAGEISGAAIVSSYLRRQEFRDAFEKAKADLRAAASY